MISFLNSSSNPPTNGVLIQPGATAFTRMLSSAKSIAFVLES
nr:hypothetical protein [Ornithinibacillus halotolerans]